MAQTVADAGRADGAVGVGYLSNDGWIGVRGEDGKKGGAGQGAAAVAAASRAGPWFACPAGPPQSGRRRLLLLEFFSFLRVHATLISITTREASRFFLQIGKFMTSLLNLNPC